MSTATPSETERQAIRAAAQWYARLYAGQASDADRNAWQHWYAASAEHQRAWARVEQVRQQFARVPGQLAGPTLGARALSRRQMLGGLGSLALGLPLAWLAWRDTPWQAWLADYRSAVGERREVTLADGSSLTLNTDSAVDVLFDPRQRLLRLLRGEIFVSTAPDPSGSARPFRVETPQGRILALGTRFSVRLLDGRTRVAVLDKAVEVRPQAAPQRSRILHGGEQLDLDALELGQLRHNDANTAAWLAGSLIAVDRPLGELLEELSRYRSGVLHCDPRVAGLKVSGNFPIGDTDLALAALESGFDLRIVRHTRFWVSVQPRA